MITHVLPFGFSFSYIPWCPTAQKELHMARKGDSAGDDMMERVADKNENAGFLAMRKGKKRGGKRMGRKRGKGRA